MEKEIWRDIDDYIGLYQVSNMGRVKSVERVIWDNRGYYKTVPERILKAGKINGGYMQVGLCKEGKTKKYLVHQLVASAFVENPEGYKEINHISEDKTNNKAENLEWCSRSYNVNYGTRNNRMAEKLRGMKQSEEQIKKKSRPVLGINKVSGLIVEFNSAREASRQLVINQSSIWECCQGKRKSAGGYTWHYVEDKEASNE